MTQLAMNQTQAAKSLGVTDRTLRKWTKAGDLKPFRKGGVVLYPVDDLRNFIKPVEGEKAATDSR